MKSVYFFIIVMLLTYCSLVSCKNADNQENVTYIESKIAENPEVIDLYYYLVNYYWNEQVNIEKTLETAELCIRNNPQNEDAFVLAAQVCMKTGYLQAGKNLMLFYLENYPEAHNIRLALVRYFIDNEKFFDAEKMINAGIMILESDEIPENSQQQNEQTIKILKNRFLLEKAKCLHKSEKLDSVWATCIEMLENNELDPKIRDEIFLIAAKTAIQLAKIDNIFKIAKNIFNTSVDSAAFVEIYSNLLIHEQKYNELKNQLAGSIKNAGSEQNKQQVLFQLAIVEILENNVEQAQKYISLGLQLGVDNSSLIIFDYYLMFYQAQKNKGLQEELLAKFEMLLASNLAILVPPEKFTNFQKILTANCKLFLGNFDLAYSLYQEVVNDEDEFTWGFLALAELSIENNEYSEAIYWYYKSIDKAVNFAEIFCQIGDCYLKMQNLNQAENSYKIAHAKYPGLKRALRGIEITKILAGEEEYSSFYPLLLSSSTE